MIFLSLKTYKEATGQQALQLLSAIKKISEQTNTLIIPCAQPTDIYQIKKELNIEVWAQHIDPIDPDRHMGWISPYSIKEAGATGTIINHSEHPLTEELIKKTIDSAKKYQLKTLVLCQTPEMAEKIALFNPDYIGYEKEELIAGPISMIDKEEENIKYLAKKISIPLIVGAGIATKEDIVKSLKAGAKGVILSSAFVKAQDPSSKLNDLATAFSPANF